LQIRKKSRGMISSLFSIFSTSTTMGWI
jgi:hypothetical protein